MHYFTPVWLWMFTIIFLSISTVPLFRDYFRDFAHLAFVRLNRNQLSDKGVPKTVFNISTLLDLQLSHNQLASVPLFNSHLEHLHLNHNSIQSKSSQNRSSPTWGFVRGSKFMSKEIEQHFMLSDEVTQSKVRNILALFPLVKLHNLVLLL